MSPNDFRRIALGMENAIEGAHMGHPDFRIHGRIFASIHPDQQFGMVTLTPDQQHQFVREHPAAFAPESGAWGRSGYTRVHLDVLDEDVLGEAMTLAWQNTVKKPPVARRSRQARTAKRTRTLKTAQRSKAARRSKPARTARPARAARRARPPRKR